MLKNEPVHHRRYQNRAQTMVDVTEYIEIFDNHQRRLSRHGYRSPAAIAKEFHRQQQAV